MAQYLAVAVESFSEIGERFVLTATVNTAPNASEILKASFIAGVAQNQPNQPPQKRNRTRGFNTFAGRHRNNRNNVSLQNLRLLLRVIYITDAVASCEDNNDRHFFSLAMLEELQ